MSIIDDLLLNAKSVAGTVGKKTGELVDSAKIRLSIAEVKSELSKKYEALGRLVYDSLNNNEDGSSDLINEKTQEIKELEFQLETLKITREEAKKANAKRTCSVCSEPLSEDAAFCSKCGAKVSNK